MKKYLIVLLCFLLTGCAENTTEYEEAEMVDSNLNTTNSVNAQSLSSNDVLSEFEIYLKNPNEGKILEAGIYITQGSGYETIPDFEKASTTHTIYGFEMDMTDEFPISHILQCYVNGKTPFVTVFSNNSNSLNFIDSFRLAREFGSLNIPIYLNLLPYSSNTWQDFEEYKKTFEDTSTIFKSFAPNTNIVWSLYSSDITLYDSVMPDDLSFDSTGLMYYGQIDNEGNDFLNSLDLIYGLTEKPIIISALGISHYSTENHKYRNDEAAEIINNIYTNLALNYPKVISIMYNDKDLTVKSPFSVICNNYRVTDDAWLLESYSQTVEHFIETPSNKYIKTPFAGKIIHGRYFVPKEMFEYYNLTISDMAEESFEHSGYIALDSLNSINTKTEDNIVYISNK